MEKSKKGIVGVFPAFASKNFQLYFLGQSVSLIGTWLQIVAEGWLVLSLTRSPFLIGLVAALATLPTLFLSLFGGVIVDHFSTRKVMIFTQAASMVLALIYGFLTILNIINIWEIMILAFLLGVVNALDFPARQAFTVEIVEKKDLSSAIAINAGTFNGARAVGPGVAGILIGLFGVGGAFIINGLSYIASIIALLKMDVKEAPAGTFENPLKSAAAGIVYSFSHPKILSLLLFTSVVAIFGWSYTTVLPLISQTVFNANATELGYLFACAGAGAVVAMVILSVFKKIDPLRYIIGGTALFAVSMLAFTYTTSLLAAYAALFVQDWG